MSTELDTKRASFTLFSVTRENREIRSRRIREFFETQPALAYLMAAFDFEWTVRRAILLLSHCPIPVIKARFDLKRYAGWNDYQGAWKCCVLGTRNDIQETLGRVIFGGPPNNDISKDERDSLQQAMNFRNSLVHGLSGSIPADKADEKFNLLLNASENITTFVDNHSLRIMFSRASRPSAKCKRCKKRKCCKFQRERKVVKDRAENRRKEDVAK